jgi:hypothetical protein
MFNLIKRCFMAAMIIIGLMATASAENANPSLIMPNPDIAPAEVVAIQMMALQNNDRVEDDLGILQTWTFAHPDNKAVTGPYLRFAGMIKTPTYAPMINHLNHRIVQSQQGEGQVEFLVEMEDQENQLYRFVWVVKQVTGGNLDKCWMTAAVSAPLAVGQGS